MSTQRHSDHLDAWLAVVVLTVVFAVLIALVVLAVLVAKW